MKSQRLTPRGLVLNQIVVFVGAEFRIKELLEDGRVVLGSMSKNLEDRMLRAKDVKYVYPSKDKASKKFRVE